jgi:hypothetical protein
VGQRHLVQDHQHDINRQPESALHSGRFRILQRRWPFEQHLPRRQPGRVHAREVCRFQHCCEQCSSTAHVAPQGQAQRSQDGAGTRLNLHPALASSVPRVGSSPNFIFAHLQCTCPPSSRNADLPASTRTVAAGRQRLPHHHCCAGHEATASLLHHRSDSLLWAMIGTATTRLYASEFTVRTAERPPRHQRPILATAAQQQRQ